MTDHRWKRLATEKKNHEENFDYGKKMVEMNTKLKKTVNSNDIKLLFTVNAT